jgi:hypothetical protein
MNGKSKCKILKDIRKKIAEENDIAYVTSECKYQGDCSGTCPKCEAELRYLEEELAKRKNLGKTVAVAGVAAALVIGSTGCAFTNPNQLVGDVPLQETTAGAPPIQDTTCATQPLESESDGETIEILGDIELEGRIVLPEEEPTLVMGAIEQPEDPT